MKPFTKESWEAYKKYVTKKNDEEEEKSKKRKEEFEKNNPDRLFPVLMDTHYYGLNFQDYMDFCFNEDLK